MPGTPINSPDVKSIFSKLAVALGAAGPLAAAPEAVDFVREIRPIFAQHCYQCHGSDKQKSGLRLDVREAAFAGGEYHKPNIIPGDSAGSTLIKLVRGEHEDLRMPPKGDGLAAEAIAKLATWIDEGASWPDGVDDAELEDRSDHWAFKPLARFEEAISVDEFVARRLAAHGLTRSAAGDRLQWLRRVTFDLTGLPPTPEQVGAFLNDPGDDAYERVVEELLASPRYGERWAQHWLDVVRYADTEGFEVNTPRPQAWPYRDYVIEAFNNDTPFDRFIREQLAGDQLGEDAATGFLVTAARLLPGQIGKDAASMRLARQDELGEIVINTSEAFLGLTMGCARCHNHKFDAITAKDYYAMQAFFSGVRYGEREVRSPESTDRQAQAKALEQELRDLERRIAGHVPLAGSGVERPPVNPRLNIERFAPVKARKVRFTIRKSNLYEPCLDELEVFDTSGRNVGLAAAGAVPSASGSNVEANRHQLEFLNDGEFGNSRSWMCSTSSGWAMLEFPAEHTIDRIAWGRDREGKYEDRLAVDYRIEVADDSGRWRAVADSGDRRKGDPQADPLEALDAETRAAVASLTEEKMAAEVRLAELQQSRKVFGGVFGTPEPTYLLHRGDPEQPREEVPPAVPEVLGNLQLPLDAPEGSRRLALADWIASDDNPLTARVAVNRIWQGHFGIGLVETSNDFGRMGAAPSHPGLLDWLASEFIASGWSVKHLHRLIVLSETYRQSARIRPEGRHVDADARLLWRFPARRLEAEGLRDSILAVSGRLNLKAGGPGFDLFTARGGLSGFPPIERFEGEGLRRMIYAHKIRMERDAVFGAFDCPDAGRSVSRRRQSTTPIQALNLLNSHFTIDQAEAFVERLRREAGDDPIAQIRHAYMLAYGRAPLPQELADAERTVRAHGMRTLCRAIFNSSEFLFIP